MGKDNAPSWDRLFEAAAAQAGHVDLVDAAAAGFSDRMLNHYVKIGRLERAGRGIYRLVHFPASAHEDLVALWLWSKREGVMSHETALFLQGLSDVLPAQQHITLPPARAGSRRKVPRLAEVYFASVPKRERSYIGAVVVTSVKRTLSDVIDAGLSRDLIIQAIDEAYAQGHVSKAERSELKKRARK